MPVLDEARTIASVVAYARRAAGVAEVIVVDDGSIDDSARLARAAGARVITGTMLGKGAAMEDGVRAATRDLVVFLDGDLSRLDEGVVERLTAPLISGAADFVKGAFSRAAGRVTTLTARPLLALFFPELSGIAQPLGGLVAGRRALLGRPRFETDYGVDVGLLLDAAAAGARVVQAGVGRIVHDGQGLDALAEMARQVVRVILDRAARQGRLRPGYVREASEAERHGADELSRVVHAFGSARRLAVLAVDGVLLREPFLETLARRRSYPTPRGRSSPCDVPASASASSREGVGSSPACFAEGSSPTSARAIWSDSGANARRATSRSRRR